MNIIVCIKSVVLDAPDGRVVRLPETCALNPFDRPAIEMALHLRDKESGKVTAISMGPEEGSIALREAIAMGVDSAILITDPALAGSDTLVTSKVLHAAIKTIEPFDLIIFGTRASDSDTGHVGPQTALRLDLPLVTGVYNLDFKEFALIVERKIDEFHERFRISLPGALTIHPTAIQTGVSSLKGIETAFRDNTIDKLTLADLGLSPENVGEYGSPTTVLSMNRFTRKKKCEFFEGSVDEQVEKLVHRLTESGTIG